MGKKINMTNTQIIILSIVSYFAIVFFYISFEINHFFTDSTEVISKVDLFKIIKSCLINGLGLFILPIITFYYKNKESKKADLAK
jgi:hypothetical protein